ncbi:glycosyltransferase [Candidatus Kaiserbacteria bacterium]|nr:glycosyltransferase [Candidatus Kaiserbacteria bacterium]
MKLPSISIALIAKNEAHNLDGFFESIAPIADELVVAFTPSTDDTLKKLEEWKKKVPYPVVIFEYADKPFHFGKSRNETIKRATKDFVFMLDADERPSADMCARIKTFLAERNPHAVIMQREDDMTPHLVDPQTRIIRNHEGLQYAIDTEGQLHEHLDLPAPAVWFDGVILHKQGESHWIHDHDRFFILLAREVARAENTRGLAREFLRAFASFFYKFRKEYFRKKTYLDGKKGLKYSFLRGLHSFLFHIFVGLKPRVHKNAR